MSNGFMIVRNSAAGPRVLILDSVLSTASHVQDLTTFVSKIKPLCSQASTGLMQHGKVTSEAENFALMPQKSSGVAVG